MKSFPWSKLVIGAILGMLILTPIFSRPGVLWDSAVYIGMGKYLFSLGHSGFMEASRPLVLPLFIGMLWAIGVPSILAGQILAIIFAALYLIFTFKIGKQLYDETVALFAVILVALTPVFLQFSNEPMTELPSTVFILLAIYLSFKKNATLAGLAAGVACMTRFMQLLPAIIIGVYLLLTCKKKSRLRCAARYSFGVLIPILPYLIVNQLQYQNAFWPFLLQWKMTSLTGWPWHQPWWWYLKELVFKNFLLLLAFPAVLQRENRLIALLGIVSLVTYSVIAQKENRFIIVFLPYLALLAASAIPRKKIMLFGVLFLIQAFLVFPFVPHVLPPQSLKADVDNIIVSSPLYVVETNVKANLAYYPVFNADLAMKLRERMGKDPMLIADCDLVCNPKDKTCELERGKLFAQARAMADQEFYENECSYFIVSSKGPQG